MRILVAGGKGYIGSKLVPELVHRGHDVTVVDLNWFTSPWHPQARYHKTDIMGLAGDFKMDVVIFLAGLSNDPMAEHSPSQNFIQNAAAPAYLAYISKRAGARRFIYASSCSVYGYTKNELHDETAPVSPSYPYGISKLQGEQAVLNMADESFSVISLRKGTVSGYSPRMRLDLIVNTMFMCAMRDRVITVRNPAIWRPILSINDAVRGYVRAVEADQSISGIFNLASGNHTVGEVAERVRDAMGPGIRLDIQNQSDMRNYKVSTEKAATVLSFHPRENIEDIVNELHEYCSFFRNWDDPQYYNIRVFKGEK